MCLLWKLLQGTHPVFLGPAIPQGGTIIFLFRCCHVALPVKSSSGRLTHHTVDSASPIENVIAVALTVTLGCLGSQLSGVNYNPALHRRSSSLLISTFPTRSIVRFLFNCTSLPLRRRSFDMPLMVCIWCDLLC